jgi:hypothetical protein
VIQGREVSALCRSSGIDGEHTHVTSGKVFRYRFIKFHHNRHTVTLFDVETRGGISESKVHYGQRGARALAGVTDEIRAGPPRFERATRRTTVFVNGVSIVTVLCRRPRTISTHVNNLHDDNRGC